MKLIFLGTSHGVPETDRFRSATLIETGGYCYLIDCGAPVADLLIRKGIPFDKLRAVFITHRHSDHVFGLPALVDLAIWYYKTPSWDIFMTEQKGVDAVRGMVESAIDTSSPERMRMHVYGAGEIYSDGLISVRAIPTNHMNGLYPSYAFCVDAKPEGKRVIFTGDLHHRDAADFPAVALSEESDAVVCELVHFPWQEILPKWKACRTKNLFINHYSPARAGEFSSEDRGLPFPCFIARDGEEYSF
ncbi:MAG: MBL fold metallo-hydrolase [Clostridia bacterium]|nr:MBL fold metallo-hydrolase [Clostridia bacterium]